MLRVLLVKLQHHFELRSIFRFLKQNLLMQL